MHQSWCTRVDALERMHLRWCTRADALELIHLDKVDKDMTDKDKVNKDKVEFLVPSRGPFYNCVLVSVIASHLGMDMFARFISNSTIARRSSFFGFPPCQCWTLPLYFYLYLYPKGRHRNGKTFKFRHFLKVGGLPLPSVNFTDWTQKIYHFT